MPKAFLWDYLFLVISLLPWSKDVHIRFIGKTRFSTLCSVSDGVACRPSSLNLNYCLHSGALNIIKELNWTPVLCENSTICSLACSNDSNPHKMTSSLPLYSASWLWETLESSQISLIYFYSDMIYYFLPLLWNFFFLTSYHFFKKKCVNVCVKGNIALWSLSNQHCHICMSCPNFSGQ